MAIPCAACGKPVHEHAVKCPHCGDLTGVPVDPLALAEADATLELPREQPIEHRVVETIAKVVTYAFDAAAELIRRDDDEPLPRATARDTTRARSTSVPTSGAREKDS